MRKYANMKNVFADKASLVLRKMLYDPERKWVVRDFTGDQGISLGMAQEVLEALAKLGYAERIKKGPHSYTLLTNKDRVITDWVKEYQFEANEIDTYYTPGKDILKKIKTILKKDEYALTQHTGANLITSFVKTNDVFIYLNLQNWDKDPLGILQKLELKKLVRGGNIHIIRPFYRKGAFFNLRIIKGYSVVSNLQLYLDLYNFQPRGREHAEYLKRLLEERGEFLG